VSLQQQQTLLPVLGSFCFRSPPPARRYCHVHCRFIALKGRNSSDILPDTLRQYQVTTSAAHKPRALVALLRTLSPLPDRINPPPRHKKGGKTPPTAVKGIVFVSSVDSTHRVAAFLGKCSRFLGLRAWELSSQVPRKEQATTVANFQAASRGYGPCP
jgi:superfamily II DNA/RNA helicase